MGAAGVAAPTGGYINHENLVTERPHMVEEQDVPPLSLITAIIASVVFTALLAFNTQFATNSVQGIMQQHSISTTFMGIVILPVLSNDLTPVIMAMRDKMHTSLSLTLERCMQTALMVVPLVVLIAWGMNIDRMTLDFDSFSVASLFASIIIVTYVVQEGKSNW